MCTAVVYRNGDGYGVCFNRDESDKRRPALPPEIIRVGDREILMPRDGDFAGTWLGVNDRGLVCGLLNYYERHRKGDVFVSRGLLVRDMLAGAELPSDLSVYQAFRMFFVGNDGFRLYVWDGESLKEESFFGEILVLASSGALGARVEPARAGLFLEKYYDKMALDAGIRGFLESHEPEKGAWSPCMHREDAKTVSMSCVRVSGHLASFLYRAGSPCEKREDLIRVMNIIP